MNHRAASISEALYYAEKTPVWLARKSGPPLRRVLNLQRRTVMERARNSDVRALRTALDSKGISLVTDDDEPPASEGTTR